LPIKIREMRPWCTILVPTFNGSKYLPELISSLSDAADEQCIILFIDDASVDETLEIISANSLPRTRILCNDRNFGLFATLNKALQEVETTYVSLMFQDNLVDPRYFQQMRALVAINPEINFFWTGYINVDELGRATAPGLDTGREEMFLPGRQSWAAALQRGCLWTISASISKAERLRHYGFRTDLPQCGDYEFFLRAIREDAFFYLERPLVKLRIHRGNASFRYARRSLDLKETISVFREQRSRFEADFDPALLLSLRKNLAYYVTRRFVHQAIRGSLLQAIKTLALLRGAALLLPQPNGAHRASSQNLS
jgi:glycosyltransferase involved in cell wall biosynthesis